MRVSKSEEYGLRLVMSLAVSGDQLTIRLTLFDMRHSKVERRVLDEVPNDENLYKEAAVRAVARLFADPDAPTEASGPVVNSAGDELPDDAAPPPG